MNYRKLIEQAYNEKRQNDSIKTSSNEPEYRGNVRMNPNETNPNRMNTNGTNSNGTNLNEMNSNRMNSNETNPNETNSNELNSNETRIPVNHKTLPNAKEKQHIKDELAKQMGQFHREFDELKEIQKKKELVKSGNKPECVMDQYIKIYKEGVAKYGANTTVLFQCGAHFNILGFEGEYATNVHEVSRVMDIVVSLHGKGNSEPSIYNPWTSGFPTGSISKFMNRLLDNNYTVIVVEQIPNTTPIERQITSIQSPAVCDMCFDNNTYNSVAISNNLVCIVIENQNWRDILTHRVDLYEISVGLSAIDISTNKTTVYEIGSTRKGKPELASNEIYRFLQTYRCKELIIYLESFKVITPSDKSALEKYFKTALELDRYNVSLFEINVIPPDFKRVQYQNQLLSKVFKQQVCGPGISVLQYLHLDMFQTAALSYCCLVDYIYKRNETYLRNIDKPEWWDSDTHLVLAHNAIRQLDVTSQSEKRKGRYSSLLDIMDKTVTFQGKRLLERKLLHPMIDPEEIQSSYNGIEELIRIERAHPRTINRLLQLELRSIVDFDKYHRKCNICKIQPIELANLLKSYDIFISLIEQFKIVVKKTQRTTAIKEIHKILPDQKTLDAMKLYVATLNTCYKMEQFEHTPSYRSLIGNMFHSGIDVVLDHWCGKIGSTGNDIDEIRLKLCRIIDKIGERADKALRLTDAHKIGIRFIGPKSVVLILKYYKTIIRREAFLVSNTDNEEDEYNENSDEISNIETSNQPNNEPSNQPNNEISNIEPSNQPNNQTSNQPNNEISNIDKEKEIEQRKRERELEKEKEFPFEVFQMLEGKIRHYDNADDLISRIGKNLGGTITDAELLEWAHGRKILKRYDRANNVFGATNSSDSNNDFFTAEEMQLIASLQFYTQAKNISITTNIIHKKQSESDVIHTQFIERMRSQSESFMIKFLYDNYEIASAFGRISAELDVLQSNAKCAIDYRYYKPTVLPRYSPNNELLPSFIDVQGFRHPIVERIQDDIEYIKNDLKLGRETPTDTNITGMLLFAVNNAGKSTLEKAIALNVILAQSGCYVPAESFRYRPFKNIITRLEGTDNMWKGQGSFAVEMSELRTVTNQADANTLVLGDEICRGTEQNSAISIMSGTVEWLCKIPKTNFIFSSHYHEMLEFEKIKKLSELGVYHLKSTIDRTKDTIVYDYKLTPGVGDTLFGIEVARCMGYNEDICNLAAEYRNERLKRKVHFLDTKTSKYCKNLYMDRCSIPGCNDPLFGANNQQSLDTHHQKQQHTADADGKIDHHDKNAKHNLIPLCKKHHLLGDRGILNFEFKMTGRGPMLFINQIPFDEFDIDSIKID